MTTSRPCGSVCRSPSDHPWADDALRARLFAILETHILPGTDRSQGRPGMDLWRILVMGVIKQGLDCDYDRLCELAGEHKTLRAFLGHGDDAWDDARYEDQTVVDTIAHLTPVCLAAVSRAGGGGRPPGQQIRSPEKSLARRWSGALIPSWP